MSRPRSLAGAVLAILSLFAASCTRPAPPPEPADRVIRGGRIFTMDEAKPEVEAIAIRGDTIAAVGTAAEIEPLIGEDTEVIDLEEGQFAMPGFIEGHGHFLGVGQARMQLDLTGARTWDEIVDMVAEAVKTAKPGAWITGRGWHQEKWDRPPQPNVEGLPYHDSLSAVSPDHPVVLTHASGHASFANAKAMELGGVDADTPDPEGGTIVRDAQGRAIGAFRETASALVERKTPPAEAELRQAVKLATEEALSKGVTSFQDAGSPVALVDLYRRMAQNGELGIRLWVMFRDSTENLTAGIPRFKTASLDKFFTVGGIKHSIDGALGSHGAWLLEPYSDLPESTGLNTVPISTIETSAELAIEHGLQLCVHAIGDRANRETLDLYQRTFEAHPDRKDLRWRIEHAQHLHPDDIPRFAELGVIAAMQAVHCTSDAPWVPDRLGDERAANGAYMWRSLLDSGAVVTNGTDAPVEDVDPLPSIYASVTRMMLNGEPFYPDQAMTREEALRSYTLSNAYAAFEEDLKGSLAPGKLADIVVLSRDLLTVPDEEILDTEVEMTLLGGKVVYSRGAGPAPTSPAASEGG